MKWKDITTYGQGIKEKIPETLRCEIGNLSIIVHRIHRLDGWYLTCRYLNIEHDKLDYDKLQDCQNQAVEIVRQALFAKAQEIQDIRKILKELEVGK